MRWRQQSTLREEATIEELNVMNTTEVLKVEEVHGECALQAGMH